MKQHSETQKTTGRNAQDVLQAAAAGAAGVALAPPAYGMVFLDSGQTQTANAPNAATMQRQTDIGTAGAAPAMQPVNRTGLPDRLKTGIESISGLAMNDVRVHYNSPKPAQVQALAYAQGTDIHIGPGQERHLPHEAWHVVQQKQGRVKPTMQMKNVHINDQPALEHEADQMGRKAALASPAVADTAGGGAGINSSTLSALSGPSHSSSSSLSSNQAASPAEVIQCATEFKFKTRNLTYDDGSGMAKTTNVGEVAEAWIDPSHPVQGTTTPPRTGVFQDMNLIQGHLVNAQVGGPGRNENFFPITASMNGQHKNNIELPLKYHVVTLHNLQQNSPGWANRHIYYRTTVVPQSWNAFDSTIEQETQFQCQIAYTNAQHQILQSLPITNFTASDAVAAVHNNLDLALTNLGAGAPGAPTTTALGGRHYTLGPPVVAGGVTTKDLFLNTVKIGVVES
jgi:hypothetical protein